MLCYARNHVNQVTGISKCQESPNCGQNDKKTRFSLEPAVDRQAREAKPSQAKPSQAKPADGSAGRLRCGPSTIWVFFLTNLVFFGPCPRGIPSAQRGAIG